MINLDTMQNRKHATYYINTTIKIEFSSELKQVSLTITAGGMQTIRAMMEM